MTRTALEAGSVGISRQRNEPKNAGPERETGGLCERLERLKPIPTNPYGRPYGQLVNPDGPEASSTIRAQADDLAFALGALRAAKSTINGLGVFVGPRISMVENGIARLEAARALKTEGTSA